MPRALVTVVGLALVAAGIMVAPAPTGAETSPDQPAIVAVYPNPVAAHDAGEFVVLSVPQTANLSRYVLTDGETTVHLPPIDSDGPITLSTAANHTSALVDGQVRQLPGRLDLANDGETIELRAGNRTVDDLSYADAPEGEIRHTRSGDTEWRQLGATDRPIVTAEGGAVEAFVLPDAGGFPAETLAEADDRILLASYTLTSRRVGAILRRAHRRNVTVRVLADGSPVGGMPERQVTALDRLTEAGIEVRVVGSDLARYRFHHAKYAVVDDRALVTTENWKPAGVGGHGSRGWGVVTGQPRIVEGLTGTFEADAGWQDAVPWPDYREEVNATASDRASATFPTQIEPASLPVERTQLLVAPDNAEGAVVDALHGADESIWIEQAGVGSVRQPFVRASVDAARRGVSVRILLGNRWYNREENGEVADRLNAIADREDLDLEARLAEPRGRFEKIHAKGAVIDGERVLLGSLNWNNNSARENREVVLQLTGEEIGGYYESVVMADWRGGNWRLTVGLLVTVVLAALLALGVARRITFRPVSR